jgi:hypothetical protein
MNTQERVARCAARLRARWPHVPDDQLREVATDVQRDAWRRIAKPEHAAAEWLRPIRDKADTATGCAAGQ